MRSALTKRAASVGQARVEAGNLELDDAPFLLEAGEIDEQMQAAPAQRLGQLARAIGSQHDDRTLAARDSVPSSGMLTWKSDSSSSRNASNSSSALSISSISRTTVRGDDDRAQQRTLEQVVAREQMLGDLFPAQPLMLIGLQAQELLLIIPFVERARFVETLVTLQPDKFGAEHLGQHLGDLGLARAGRTFDQQRLFEREREKDRGLDALVGDVARRCRRPSLTNSEVTSIVFACLRACARLAAIVRRARSKS